MQESRKEDSMKKIIIKIKLWVLKRIFNSLPKRYKREVREELCKQMFTLPTFPGDYDGDNVSINTIANMYKKRE